MYGGSKTTTPYQAGSSDTSWHNHTMHSRCTYAMLYQMGYTTIELWHPLPRNYICPLSQEVNLPIKEYIEEANNQHVLLLLG